MRALRRFFWGRIGTPEPSTVTATDETPDPFTLTDVTGVATSAVQTSNVITVTGLGAGVFATASIAGTPTSVFRKNGGPWQTSNAFVQNGDTLQVQHVSSAFNSASASTTLTVGTFSEDFKSTTLIGGGPTGSGIGGWLFWFTT